MRAAVRNPARKPQASRGVQSIEVGHRLLTALVDAGNPLILRDLAAAAALAPAQAHAYLASFRRVGLVEQEPDGGRYALGPFAMRLGMAVIRSSPRLAEASRTATSLAEQLGLTVCLTVWGPQAPTVVQVQDGGQPLDLNIREGTIFSVTGTATGRLFAALSDAASVRRRIADERSGKVLSQRVATEAPQVLQADRSSIRTAGLAITKGRPIPGINAVAAPIRDEDGALVAALTLIGTSKTLPLGARDAARPILRAEAARISSARARTADTPARHRPIVPATYGPDDARGVQAVEVGTRLLTALVEAGRPMMLREVARLAGLPAAGAHAYLVSYRNCGLVEQGDGTGLYRLGRPALDLAIVRMRTIEPLRMARDAIRNLAIETGLTVGLAVWGTNGPTIVDVSEGSDQIHIATRPGTVYSIAGTATGRVFAAFLPDAVVRLAARAESTSGRPRSGGASKLNAAIRRVRENGYATIDTPPIPGVEALSAPVFDHVGQIRMAMTVMGPASTFKAARNGTVVRALLRTTRALSSRLGYDGMTDAN
jgi:DNA-binding IclR family transcriptional regulator